MVVCVLVCVCCAVLNCQNESVTPAGGDCIDDRLKATLAIVWLILGESMNCVNEMAILGMSTITWN